jgi:hypothetical protein
VLGETFTKVPTVLGERVPSAPRVPVAVAPQTQTRTPSSLPMTGAKTGLLAMVGAALCLAGLVLLTVPAIVRRSGRLRRAHASGS